MAGGEECSLRLGELRMHDHRTLGRHRARDEHERFGGTGGEQDVVRPAAVAGRDGGGRARRVGVGGQSGQRRRNPVEQPVRRLGNPDVDGEVHESGGGFPVAMVAQVVVARAGADALWLVLGPGFLTHPAIVAPRVIHA